MMRLTAALVLTLAATTISVAQDTAQSPDTLLTAEGFDAKVTGRTFYYSSGGQPYGAEQYLPNRQVIWAFTGDDCKKGRWYDRDGLICFTYEDSVEEQCWTFVDGPQGLTARYWGDPGALPLIAVQQSPEPMACMGPDVGV